MIEPISTAKVPEKAILVALITPKQSAEQAQEYLEELAFLAETSGLETLNTFMQRLDRPDTRTFVGKGKLEEIKAYVNQHGVEVVIFDDDLTPSQVRNLEAELQLKILDRSLLILNIFAFRAQTSQAKAQVELAQYQYVLPRLTRMWTHLSKQRGGVGMRGPGEKELETDRRIVRDKIALLRSKLNKIEKQSETRRKSRDNQVRVALVGYTNVGKSTIMRQLAKAEVFAENKLFATVDSTVRKVVINQVPFLLTDTVGFIRKLPHALIECFKSTLDEIREADILLHVVDVSHPASHEHIEVVNNTLAEIGAADKPILMVYNKVDALEPESEEEGLGEESDPYAKFRAWSKGQPSVFISALKKENIEALRAEVYELVKTRFLEIYPNYLLPETYYGPLQPDWDNYGTEKE